MAEISYYYLLAEEERPLRIRKKSCMIVADSEAAEMALSHSDRISELGLGQTLHIAMCLEETSSSSPLYDLLFDAEHI